MPNKVVIAYKYATFQQEKSPSIVFDTKGFRGNEMEWFRNLVIPNKSAASHTGVPTRKIPPRALRTEGLQGKEEKARDLRSFGR